MVAKISIMMILLCFLRLAREPAHRHMPVSYTRSYALISDVCRLLISEDSVEALHFLFA